MMEPSHDPSDLDFPSLPPFPTTVPTAPLLRISLARLLSHDSAEEDKLWRASTDLGFFYLDLRAPSPSSSSSPSDPASRTTPTTPVNGPALLRSAAALFALAPAVFALPLSEKQRYDHKAHGSYFGYKGFGAGAIDAAGTPDRNEFWNVSKDDVLGVRGGEAGVPSPALLTAAENRARLAEFVCGAHAVAGLILARLERRLGVEEGALAGRHRLDAPSGDQVRWVKSPPQPVDDRRNAMGEHTDFGSVTVLFNRLGGLQVLLPPPAGGEDPPEWAYVKPLRDHCVVNLGDAMVKFTAGVLRSNLHRVVNCPGEQSEETRYSLAYFGRPENDVVLKVLPGSEMIEDRVRSDPSWTAGEQVSAQQWILNRAMGRRVGGDWNKSADTDTVRSRKGEGQKRDSGVATSAS